MIVYRGLEVAAAMMERDTEILHQYIKMTKDKEVRETLSIIAEYTEAQAKMFRKASVAKDDSVLTSGWLLKKARA